VSLVAEGRSNKEIARHLGVTDGTVKIHLHNIYRKLDVSNRTALTAWALRYRDQSPSVRLSS
jgi:two-component system nitrate/nitrite response regulator NarL